MAESLIQVPPDSTGKKPHTWSRVIGANTVEDEVVILGENYLAGYSVSVVAISTATANSHLMQIMAGASNRVRIRRIEVHQWAMATTVVLAQLIIYRLTTAGTGGTAATPQPFDTSDAASGATAMTLPTVKGTEAGIGFAASAPYMMQTLAASAQLDQPIGVWDFDRPRTKPLTIATGVTNGIAVKCVNAIAAGQVVITVWFDESSFA